MRFFTLLITLLFLFSCKETEKIETEHFTFLNKIPNIIDPESAVVKIYLDKQLPNGLDFSKASKLNGDGEFYIKNDYINKTLLITFRNLEPKREYNFRLDLSKVKAEGKKLVGTLNSDFIAKENSLILNTNLLKIGKEFKISSTIRSTYKLDYEKLKGSIRFSNSDIYFDLRKKSNKEFEIITQPFASETGKITLNIDSKQLGISRDYADEVYINNSNYFDIVDFYTSSYQDQKRVELITNGNFEGVDLSGFIRFDNGLKFRAEIDKNRVLIIGDFLSGEKYNFTILEGLKDKNNLVLAEDYKGSALFNNRLPEIRFTSSGYILPSSKDKSIKLESVNVKKVRVKLWKVYENNTLFFLKNGTLSSGRKSTKFNWNTQELGDLVYNREHQVFEKLNKSTVSEIIIPDSIVSDKGFYILGVTFNREDMVYTKGEFAGYNSNKNPDSYSYMYNNGRLYKSLSFTDIGISVSKQDSSYNFFINSITTSKPLKGATIEVISPKNQKISASTANSQGTSKVEIGKYFDVVRVKYKGDINYIKLRGSELNRSVYNIEGSKPKGKNDIFFYTDRGVYRPGESINLSGIVGNHKLDSDLPISIRVYTPDNRLKHSLISKLGDGKLFTFNLETDQNDPTGDWPVYVELMGKTYNYSVKVHSVIPHKIRVSSKLKLDDSKLKIEISSSYLNGVAYEGSYSSEIIIDPYKPKFDSFKGYRFFSGVDPFKRVTKNLADGSLDSKGKVSIIEDLNQFGVNNEYSLNINVRSKVYESSGRVVETIESIEKVDDNIFIGVDKPFLSRVNAGDEVPLKFIVVDRDGKPISGRELGVEIYTNQSIWWYEYNNRNALKEFVSHNNTVLRESFNYRSKTTPEEIFIMPEPWGPLMVKIVDKESSRESLSIIKSSWWDGGDGLVDAEILNISSSKLKYNSGEEVELTLDCDKSGTALISIEKDKEIFKQEIIDLSDLDTYKFEATDEMSPGVYANIRIYQPESRENSKPERMLGISYIKIEKGDMRSEAVINIQDRIEPLKEYTLNIDTKTAKKSYITLSIVDEGILNITNFKTPQPDKFFYSKSLHGFNLYDNFSGILDSYNGLIDRRFTMGGGESEMRKRGLNRVKANRFKPVAIFSKIIETDEYGKCEYSFTIPNYTGSVRMMVTGRSGEQYISGEKDVVVKPDLALLPELPAVLGVNERVKIPVTIFCDSVVTDDVELKVTHSEGLTIVPEKISIKPKERVITHFEIITESEVGKKDITFESESGKYKASRSYEIAQRPSAPYEQSNSIHIIKPGESLTLDIETLGVLGTDIHNLSFGNSLMHGLKGRVSTLLNYPYGCLEQTITKAYAQLFLKPIFKGNRKALNKIDNNINTTMKKIAGFGAPGGGFSLWEGGEFYPWATTYALQFIGDAKKLGYSFNPNIEKMCFKRLNQYVNTEKQYYSTPLRSIPILQEYGYDMLPRLNYYRELYLDNLGGFDKAYLALCYKLYGEDTIANQIYNSIDFDQIINPEIDYYDDNYWDYYYYWDRLSLNAQIASIMFQMGDEERAYKLSAQIVKSIDSSTYISTYSMSEIMKAFNTIFGDFPSESIFSLEINGDNIDAVNGSILLNNYEDDRVKIKNITDDIIYLDHYHTYLPLKSKKGVSESSGIKLKTRWVDSDFNPVDFKKVKRNEDIYQIITVINSSGRTINQIALSQVVPPGLKPVNPAITKYDTPRELYGKKRELSIISKDYRDDRVNLFFDLYKSGYANCVILKYNVTFEGNYYLPPVKAEAMYDGATNALEGGYDMKVIE